MSGARRAWIEGSCRHGRDGTFRVTVPLFSSREARLFLLRGEEDRDAYLALAKGAARFYIPQVYIGPYLLYLLLALNMVPPHYSEFGYAIFAVVFAIPLVGFTLFIVSHRRMQALRLWLKEHDRSSPESFVENAGDLLRDSLTSGIAELRLPRFYRIAPAVLVVLTLLCPVAIILADVSGCLDTAPGLVACIADKGTFLSPTFLFASVIAAFSLFDYVRRQKMLAVTFA